MILSCKIIVGTGSVISFYSVRQMAFCLSYWRFLINFVYAWVPITSRLHVRWNMYSCFCCVYTRMPLLMNAWLPSRTIYKVQGKQYQQILEGKSTCRPRIINLYKNNGSGHLFIFPLIILCSGQTFLVLFREDALLTFLLRFSNVFWFTVAYDGKKTWHLVPEVEALLQCATAEFPPFFTAWDGWKTILLPLIEKSKQRRHNR
jgi:hypothetical protein